MGRDINILGDKRVENLSKKKLSQYEKVINEAYIFFNDKSSTEEEKQKLLMAINEIFFMSKEINRKK